MSEPLTPAMFALLLALTEHDSYGYQLAADVERLTNGALALGPGTLYRTLQRIRVDGLAEEVEPTAAAVRADGRAERRRCYRITHRGVAAVRGEAWRLSALLASDAAQALLRPSQGG